MEKEILVQLAEMRTELREIREDIREIKEMVKVLNGIQRRHDTQITKLQTSRKYVWMLSSVTIGLISAILGALVALMFGG